MRDKLLDADFEYGDCRTGCTWRMLEVATKYAICNIMRYYYCSESLEQQLRRKLKQVRASDLLPTPCEDCIDHLCVTARELDKELPSGGELCRLVSFSLDFAISIVM